MAAPAAVRAVPHVPQEYDLLLDRMERMERAWIEYESCSNTDHEAITTSLLRLFTPNGVAAPSGYHKSHWFDLDLMKHAIAFSHGSAHIPSRATLYGMSWLLQADDNWRLLTATRNQGNDVEVVKDLKSKRSEPWTGHPLKKIEHQIDWLTKNAPFIPKKYMNVLLDLFWEVHLTKHTNNVRLLTPTCRNKILDIAGGRADILEKKFGLWLIFNKKKIEHRRALRQLEKQQQHELRDLLNELNVSEGDLEALNCPPSKTPPEI